jgi:hypothetical protein
LGYIEIGTNTTHNKQTNLWLSIFSCIQKTQRVNDIYSNDIANTPALILVSFLYLTVVKPSAEASKYMFGALVLSRYLHTLSYAVSTQPLRGVSFLSGVFVGLGMGVEVLKKLLVD